MVKEVAGELTEEAIEDVEEAIEQKLMCES